MYIRQRAPKLVLEGGIETSQITSFKMQETSFYLAWIVNPVTTNSCYQKAKEKLETQFELKGHAKVTTAGDSLASLVAFHSSGAVSQRKIPKE